MADAENIYSATNKEADQAGLHRSAPPPAVPSERDFARVSRHARVNRHAAVWVTCGFAPLDRPHAECKGRFGELDRHDQVADQLHPERGMVPGPWRLTLDHAYRQDQDGHWVERPRMAHRRELGREELGRKIPAEVRWMRDNHLVSDDEVKPTLPAKIRCRTCNHWRWLDAERLGVGHPDNQSHA